MNPSQQRMLKFIDAIRNSDEYIEDIFMSGGCYRFHLLLKEFFPKCIPLMNKRKNHVVTWFYGKLFDITGEVEGDYKELTSSDVVIADKWSFNEHNLLKITECPACEEPITA